MDFENWLNGLRLELRKKGLFKQAQTIEGMLATAKVIGDYGATAKLDGPVQIKFKVNGEEKTVEFGGNSLESAIAFVALTSLLLNI